MHYGIIAKNYDLKVFITKIIAIEIGGFSSGLYKHSID